MGMVYLKGVGTVVVLLLDRLSRTFTLWYAIVPHSLTIIRYSSWELIAQNVMSMNIQFSREELAAVLKMANAMIAVDGKIEDVETSLLGREMIRLRVNENEFNNAYRRSEEMKYSEALRTISLFDWPRKKYLGAFLGTIMAIDGEIDANETKLWNYTAELCELPLLSIEEATEIMNIKFGEDGNIPESFLQFFSE